MTVDIAALKALAEAATPGPWDTDTVHNEGDYGNGDVHNAWDAVIKANAAFITSAVAALITEIETLRAAVHALTVERDEAKVRQVDWQEGCPARPYGEAWFLAVMASGDRVVLRELPEEYAYDFKTADDTYVKRENVNRWAQFPDSEFLFPREKLAAALARVAVLEKTLEPIVTEFSCTIEQYYKLGPDFTHKDGTEVFAVQSILDREPLIEAARAALSRPISEKDGQ